VTDWRVLGRGTNSTWPAPEPLTGRTHQLRVPPPPQAGGNPGQVRHPCEVLLKARAAAGTHWRGVRAADDGMPLCSLQSGCGGQGRRRVPGRSS
jgi:hypothetical protein